MEHHPQFTYWCKECPRHRTIHIKNGVESGYADVDPKTCGSDSLIKSQPQQIIHKYFQHIQCKAVPPLLFEDAYPPQRPKVCGRVISSHIHELVQKGQILCRVLPHGNIATNIFRVQTEDASRSSTFTESTAGQNPHVYRFCAPTHQPDHLSLFDYRLKKARG